MVAGLVKSTRVTCVRSVKDLDNDWARGGSIGVVLSDEQRLKHSLRISHTRCTNRGVSVKRKYSECRRLDAIIYVKERPVTGNEFLDGLATRVVTAGRPMMHTAAHHLKELKQGVHYP